MAKIKDKIFAEIDILSCDQKIIDIAALQEAEKILECFPGENNEESELEELLQDLDPAFLIYMQVVEFILMIATLLSSHPSLKKNMIWLQKIENKYRSDDLLGCVTDSYFNFWRLFDLQIDESGETIATLCLSIAEYLGNYQEELQDLAIKACNTRMGLYVNIGEKDGNLLLREILTNKEIEAICPTIYQGQEGEIWFVRIFPPVEEDQPSIIMTTPYIIMETTEEEWINFFKRIGLSRDSIEWEKALEGFMKHGPKPDYWLKYISEKSIPSEEEDCIFIWGLPKVRKIISNTHHD